MQGPAAAHGVGAHPATPSAPPSPPHAPHFTPPPAHPCSLQNGTTYNSYIIFGAEATALVDASHEKFRGLYLRTLQAELAARGRGLDYVLVSHTEPDHSGGWWVGAWVGG